MLPDTEIKTTLPYKEAVRDRMASGHIPIQPWFNLKCLLRSLMGKKQNNYITSDGACPNPKTRRLAFTLTCKVSQYEGGTRTKEGSRVSFAQTSASRKNNNKKKTRPNQYFLKAEGVRHCGNSCIHRCSASACQCSVTSDLLKGQTLSLAPGGML